MRGEKERRKRMSKRIKMGWSLLLICWLLSAIGARAEFSSAWGALLSAKEGREARVTVNILSLPGYTKEGVQAMNDWLSSRTFVIGAREEELAALRRIALEQRGKEVFFAQVQREKDGVRTFFSPAGRGYLTDSGEKHALALLTSLEQPFMDVSSLPQAYTVWAEGLYPALQKRVTPKESKGGVSIKNTSGAARSEIYTLTAQQMDEAFQESLPALLKGFGPMLATRPDLHAQAAEALPKVRFSSSCTVKRFLDRAGKDMGMQLTGNACIGKDERKVTLYGGFTENKGGYLSLALPEATGKGNWKAQLSVQVRQRKDGNAALAGEGHFVCTTHGQNRQEDVTFSLKNAIAQEKEQWTGKVTCTRTEKKSRTVYTLTPDLRWDKGNVQGSMGVEIRKNGGKAARLALTIRCAAPTQALAHQTGKCEDIRGQNASGQLAALAPESAALARMLDPLLKKLTPQDRERLVKESGLKLQDAVLYEDISAPDEDLAHADKLVLTLGGDAVLGTRETWWKREDAFPAFLKAHGMDWPFSGLQELFATDDMTLVNLECVLKEDGAGEQKDKLYRFRGLPAWTDALKRGSIEQVNIANNHHVDYGGAGRRATRQALEKANIPYSGYGSTFIWEKNGHKVGFAGMRETIYRQDKERLAQEIANLRKQGCQVVVYNCHWGQEYSKKHSDLQKEMANAAVQAGADIVVGAHPHVVQGVDRIGHAPVIWSLGNLMFGGTIEMTTFDAALARVTLLFDAKKAYRGCRVEMIPILTSSRADEGINDYHPVLAQGAHRTRIMKDIQQDSRVRVDGVMWFPAK